LEIEIALNLVHCLLNSCESVLFGVVIASSASLSHTEALARLGHALSDPTRCGILLALREAPAYPSDLAHALLFGHGDRALVVGDHAGQEQSGRLGAAGILQGVHVGLAHHPAVAVVQPVAGLGF
jgi:hypothetical protein